jgi:hypothetical protein
MQPSRLLFVLALFLAPVAFFSTTWLYLYPFFHGCNFPVPPTQAVAPFRLLALGDPQLEGDTKLPNPEAPIFPSLRYLRQDVAFEDTLEAKLAVIKRAGSGALQDARRWLEGKRKAVDLWGNDWYLAHIVRQTRWWARPTHVAVLGDLLGSQWITDGEFEKRAGRYWGVVMRGLEMVPRRVFGMEEEQDENSGEDGAGIGPNKVEEEITGPEHDKQSGGEEDVILEETKVAADEVDDNVDAIEESQADMGENEEHTNENEDRQYDRETQDERGKENAHEEESQRNAVNENEHKEESIESHIGEAQEDEGVDVNPDQEQSPDNGNENDHEQNEEGQSGSEETKEEEQKPLRKPSWGGTTEVLGADEAWANRVINIAGNHDVGYAGDLDESRVARFEKAFGSVNWDIWFTLPSDNKTSEASDNESITPPALRIVVLNTMNIDAPAWSYELQTETYSFMNHIITTSRAVQDKTHATILLTHIPLEKEPGVCVDSPYFNYFDDGQGVREQNMLSEHSSKTVLQGVYGMSDSVFAAGEGLGRRGIVLNGHDHEGCDVMHFIRQEGVFDACNMETVKQQDAYWPPPPPPPPRVPETFETSPVNPFVDDAMCPVPEPTPSEPAPKGWRAHRFPTRPYDITRDPSTNTTSCTSIEESPHLREITLRSMMGDFSGHAGFLSAWFDADKGEWVFEFASCGVGVQHWWWAVHSVDFSLVVVLVLASGCWVVERFKRRKSGFVKDRVNGKMNGM